MKLILINPRNKVSLYGDYLWEPLALGYVAAATPAHWEVELIDEQCEGTRDYHDVEADLVGLTAFTTQATRAYDIAEQFRSRGIPVVMGGIHASLVSDEAAHYVDSLFIGECEALWPEVIADVEAGRLQPKYDGGTTGGGLLHPDRRHLRRNTATSTCRPRPRAAARWTAPSAPSPSSTAGCFACATSQTSSTRSRPFRARDIIFVDDDLNGFSRKAKERCMELFRAMADAQLNKQWITQVTINFGDDDELPRLARASGCAGVFIGLESTDTQSLALIRKDGMSQRRGVDYYRENVARIRRAGIGVVGSFILGLDTQNMDTVAGDILAFAEEIRSRRAEPDDHHAAARHARLHDATTPRAASCSRTTRRTGKKYTLAFPVTSMPHVSGAGLMRKYVDVLQFFRPEHVAARVLADARHGFARGRVAHVPLEPRLVELLSSPGGVQRTRRSSICIRPEMPREVPVRPSLDLDTIVQSVRPHQAAAAAL